MQFQPKRSQNVTFVRAFITTIGVLCQQGFIENFRKLSVQIILYTTILFSLVIFQFYSSFIVSSLLTNPPKTINTLRQLIDSQMKVGIEDITYNYDFFQTTNEKLPLELYKKKIEYYKNFYDVDSGLRKIRNGGFAFHVDTSYANRLIKASFSEDEICDLHEMLLFPIRPLYPVVAKDSPYKEIITVGLLRLVENGFVDYHSRKWSERRPKCVKSITKITSVDLTQISTVFFLLAAAICLSYAILSCEILHFKLIRKCRLGNYFK